VKLAQWDNMDSLLMMTLPVATIAAPASTTSKLDNLLNPLPVKIVPPANTMMKLGNPYVNIAAPASTPIKLGNPYAKVVPPASTCTTVNLARTARVIVQNAPMANTPCNLPPRPSLNATHVNRDVL